MTQQQILEGTWEEIALRAEELKGHRVRVIVLADTALSGEGRATREEFEAGMDELAELGAHLPPPDPDETYSRETLYADHD